MIFLNVHWIKIKINTLDGDLESFIKKYYEIFIVDFLDKIDIEINLEKYNYFAKKEYFKLSDEFITFWDYIKIDRENNRYFFKDKEVSWLVSFLDNWIIRLDWKLIPDNIRHLIHITLQGFTRINEFYNRFITKTCIHDIIFILLENKLKSCLLHATAVTNWDKTYLFTWLWGSWKSTLASGFSKLKWFSILSDNYAVVSWNNIYSFPELPRITKSTQKLLWVNLNKKADWIKDYLENNLNWINKVYNIDKIFICSYWNEFKINKLEDKNYLFEVLHSINNYTKEFPEYLNLALLSIIWKFNTNNERIENLKNIINNNDFYLLQNSKDLKNNLNKIINV